MSHPVSHTYYIIMRANKITFNKIKTQWELSKMKAAYIAAEMAIVKDASLTGWEEPKDPVVDVEIDIFGNVKNRTIKDIKREQLEGQLQELEETGRRLLKQEKYELLKEAQEIWLKIKQQLKNLK